MSNHLLLLHGALGNSEQFKALIQTLSKDFHLHFFDFEGHNHHNTDQVFSIDLFADNVLTYLKERNIAKTNIFGYSMGGYVALNFAKKHPEKVDRILTLGTKFEWTPETADKEVRMLNPDKIAEKVPSFAKKLMGMYGSENWKKVVLQTAQMMTNLSKGNQLSASDFNKINHTVHVCVGNADQMVGIEESEQVVNQLPNGTLHVLDNIEHPIEKVSVKQLQSLINQCLA